MRLVEQPNQKVKETMVESQFERPMKHLTRLSIILLVITISLSITTMANAQTEAIEKDSVLNMFGQYIETKKDTVVPYKTFMVEKNINETLIIDSQNPELTHDSLIALMKEEMLEMWKQQTQQNNTEEKQGEGDSSDSHIFQAQWKWWLLAIVALCVIVLILVFGIRAKKKREKEYETNLHDAASKSTDDVGIVVRHKTMSVMQKQNIDDVKGNGNYMEVACSDFCNDSAVTKMYIKNTCIIGIYNMYAEDLRNPDNPKEDGCMVLGRWVHDKQNDEYCVSLEEIVLPGSDAVFSEYQLNFGGQIKMKMMEKLKKLRQETELQYDLTCWVHSHPGLGVFFSNDDHNVHILHKHPTHPKFLTAIVIDILTPEQELGIFTFKHDESINSQYDLKKLYSLAEWYKWAVKSKQNSLRSEDHFNTLKDAQSHSNECYRIELTNSAIIDMDKLTAFPENKPVHFVHGFTNQDEKQSTHVATKIDEAESVPDYNLVGCFVVVTNRSLPSITKATSNYYKRIKFVLVYSTADGLLTTIPVINNDLCTDESFYGEQQLEDLKIWTRRKR